MESLRDRAGTLHKNLLETTQKLEVKQRKMTVNETLLKNNERIMEERRKRAKIERENESRVKWSMESQRRNESLDGKDERRHECIESKLKENIG